MNKKLAEYLARQRAAHKAEASALCEKADKESGGTLSAEQEARFNALEADIAMIDAEVAAAQKLAETPEEAAARVRAETADVMAACAMVGKPEKAAEFIKAGTPLAQVVSALQAERVAESPPDINSRSGGNTQASSLTWDEFRAKRKR